MVAAGCEAPDGGFATVGDRSLPLESLQAHLAAVTGEPWQSVSDPVSARLLDQFLDQEVVVAASRRDRTIDLPADPGARSARVRVLLDDLCGPVPEPDPASLERAVAEAASAERPARAHVRQMLLHGREEAEETRQKLLDGADFVALSRQVSLAPNADSGGELGFLSQGNLPDDLDAGIFELKEGEISEPVPGPSGYHLFQVLEVSPRGPSPHEELEPEARRRLMEAAAREHAAACVRRLAGEVGVTVFHDRLWFEYRGRYAEEIHAS
jgi:hypothetical protein